MCDRLRRPAGGGRWVSAVPDDGRSGVCRDDRVCLACVYGTTTMKVYRGLRTEDGCHVTVDGATLAPRRDLVRRAGEGGEDDFEWGYDGAGPTHLALALLADHVDDDARALSEYRGFRSGVIAGLGEDTWMLSTRDVDNAIQGIVEVRMTLNELLNKVRGKP